MIPVHGFLYNSMVNKELRTRMRGWRSTIILTAYMTILGIIAIAFLIQQAGPSASQSSQVGIQLFQVLAVFQLFLILFVTPASTAGSISGERQRQTWDLLLVTRLSSFGIVWGKLVAGLAFNVLLLFASLPLFSLVFLFGGVAPDDVFHTYVVFLTSVLLFGVASLLVSALTRRLAVAMIVSNIIALLLGIGVSLLALYLENWGRQTFSAGPAGMRPVPLPPLTPLAQLDPFAALGAALPNGDGSDFLGGFGMIHHAWGSSLAVPLWGVYCVEGLALSVILFLLTTVLTRHPPRWLATGGS